MVYVYDINHWYICIYLINSILNRKYWHELLEKNPAANSKKIYMLSMNLSCTDLGFVFSNKCALFYQTWLLVDVWFLSDFS